MIAELRMYGFTDLEDRLLGPEGPAALASALASVRAIAADLRASMAGGLSHTDFAQAEKILAASAAAERILLNDANTKGA
jgi:hypothetical protein